MISHSSRYLFGLLLAIVPAAASAQDALKPALRPGQMVVARQDTVVNIKRDTVITVKKDTAYVVKYDTLPIPTALPANNVAYAYGTSYNVPDSVIARAVRLGVMQALQEQQGKQEIQPRPDYLKTWDRMQERRKIKRVDRDIMRAVFIPKGQWMMGTTFNYQEWDTDNINLLGARLHLHPTLFVCWQQFCNLTDFPCCLDLDVQFFLTVRCDPLYSLFQIRL